VREREDANRTREAGHRDEVEGVVASTLNLSRNGAVGFIVWLDDGCVMENRWRKPHRAESRRTNSNATSRESSHRFSHRSTNGRSRGSIHLSVRVRCPKRFANRETPLYQIRFSVRQNAKFTPVRTMPKLLFGPSTTFQLKSFIQPICGVRRTSMPPPNCPMPLDSEPVCSV
jgi:hypothetical protein